MASVLVSGDLRSFGVGFLVGRFFVGSGERDDLEVVGDGFAAGHGEAVDLGGFAAFGQKKDGGVVGHPAAVDLASFGAFIAFGGVGELTRGIACDVDEPEMRQFRRRRLSRYGDEGLLGVRRELRVGDGSGVAEVFAGGKVRGGCLRVG